MANDVALLVKSPAATTANQPPAVRDPMIRPGSKVTFDFSDPRCHPGGVITPGAVLAGTVFTSLDTVPIQAVVQGNGGTITVNGDGSLLFSGGGGGASGLLIGAPKQFDMSAAEYERLLWIWMKFPQAGYNTANYQQIIGIFHSNNNNSQGNIDTGVGGIRPRFGVGTPVGTAAVSYGIGSADAPLNQVLQLGGRFDPGARIDYYQNGVQRTGGDTAQTDVYAPVGAEGMNFRVPNSIPMTVYRFGLVDIDSSIAAETGYGYPAADVLTAAQHVAEDYKFGTGTLAGAPKVPFA